MERHYAYVLGASYLQTKPQTIRVHRSRAEFSKVNNSKSDIGEFMHLTMLNTNIVFIFIWNDVYPRGF